MLVSNVCQGWLSVEISLVPFPVLGKEGTESEICGQKTNYYNLALPPIYIHIYCSPPEIGYMIMDHPASFDRTLYGFTLFDLLCMHK